jgi:hypothetical protein
MATIHIDAMLVGSPALSSSVVVGRPRLWCGRRGRASATGADLCGDRSQGWPGTEGVEATAYRDVRREARTTFAV